MTNRWMLRARASVQLTLLLLIAGAGPALAEGQSGTSVMDIFNVTTTDGVSLSQQPLALTSQYSVFGQDLPDPFLFLLTAAWNIYRIIAGFALWFLGEAQSGDWRFAVVEAADSTVTPFLAMLHRLDLPAIAGTAAFVLVVWVWARGRAGASLAEAGAVAVFFALAIGIFSTPVGAFTQTGGFLDDSVKVGSGISSGMGDGTGSGADRTQQRLADILVAQPGEILAFGELLNEKCHEEMVAAQVESPGEPEKVREAVADCDDKYEEQPPLESVVAVLVFLAPFLSSVLTSLYLLAALLAFLVCAVIWFSVEIGWNAIWAPFPGAARMRLINSLIKAGTAMAALVVVLVVAAVVSQVLVQIFDSVRDGDGDLLATFSAYCVASGVMTLLWVVLWWKALAHLLKSRGRTEKLKGAVSPSKPVSMPTPRMAPLASGATQIGRHALGSAVGSTLSRGRGSGGPNGMPGAATPSPPSVGDAPPPQPAQPPPGDAPPSAQSPPPRSGDVPPANPPQPREGDTAPQPSHPAPTRTKDGSDRHLKKGLAKASTKVAAHAALAAATGGTSAIAGAAGSTLATMGAKHAATQGAKQLLKKGATNKITSHVARAASSPTPATPRQRTSPHSSAPPSQAEPTVPIPVRPRASKGGQVNRPETHARPIPTRPPSPERTDAARESAQRLRERLQERRHQTPATGYPTSRPTGVTNMPTSSGTR